MFLASILSRNWFNEMYNKNISITRNDFFGSELTSIPNYEWFRDWSIIGFIVQSSVTCFPNGVWLLGTYSTTRFGFVKESALKCCLNSILFSQLPTSLSTHNYSHWNVDDDAAAVAAAAAAPAVEVESCWEAVWLVVVTYPPDTITETHTHYWPCVFVLNVALVSLFLRLLSLSFNKLTP